MAQRGLLDEPVNFFGGVQNAFENPLTLGGLSLLTGGGWGGAFQGMRTGAGMQDRRQQISLQEQERQRFQDTLKGLEGKLSPEYLSLARAQGPQSVPTLLKQLMERDDPMRQLDADYKKAQIAKMQRDASGTIEAPSNVREWQYYNSLAPEEQQRYLTMKRADKFLDTGTAFQRQNPAQPGAPIDVIPKDIAGKEIETARGKGIAEARGQMGTARATASDVSSLVESIKTDPYLSSMVGPVDSRLPNVSAAAARVQAKFDQLQGGAFMQARQLLKGGGPITDFEGKKAEQAFIRMNTAQDTEDFKAALDDFNDAVQAGVKRLEDAGMMQQQSVQREGLQPGAVEDGYRYRGGDPSDQRNWERVR